MCPSWGYDGALILSFSASFSHFSPPLTVLLRIIFQTHSHSHLRPFFGEHPKTKNPLTLRHFLHQQSECVLCVLIPQNTPSISQEGEEELDAVIIHFSGDFKFFISFISHFSAMMS